MELTRIVVLVSLMLIVPATARANWWDWIQEMSGPGPFHGRGSVIATVCSDLKKAHTGGTNDGSTSILNNRPVASEGNGDPIPCWFFDLRQLAYDGKEGNFPAAVNLTAHDFGATWQLLPHRPIEIGVGAGIAHFSGLNDVTANRFTVTIFRAVVEPIAILPVLRGKSITHNPWARLLKWHFGYIWIPGTLKAEDFGVARGSGPGQSTFSKKGEYLRSYGFLIDFGELLRPQR